MGTPQSVIQRNFAGGEIAPALASRADTTKYLTGLRTCRNFLVRRHGGVTKRPGTYLVGLCKDAGYAPRLIPFIFEGAEQTYLIEAGEEYLRFYWHGDPVVVTGAAWSGLTNYVIGDLVDVAGTVYYCIADHLNQLPPDALYWYPLTDGILEVPTPYADEHLDTLQWAQSADVLTVVHPSYPPYELRRLGGDKWAFVPYVVAPWAPAPTNLTAYPPLTGALQIKYKVTAAKADTFEETAASIVATAANVAAPTPTAPIGLTWDPVVGAEEYYIYADPFGNGVYGFIGTARPDPLVYFWDAGFTPDFTVTPPIERTLFNATDEYPGAVAYYQQRIVFARSNDAPEHIWMSQVGAYHNFTISTPLQDDDAMLFALASNQLNPVQHLVGLKKLVVLSDEGEWVLQGDVDGVLRPSAINADQHGYIGATRAVRPKVIGNSLLYVQSRGSIVRELHYEQDQAGFVGGDMTIFAAHLFDGYSIVDLDYQQQSHSIMWVVRSDGVLLGLTYIADQEISGWHWHVTGENGDGEFERVCVLPDTATGQDVVYFVVKRVINGNIVRYIERFSQLVTQHIDEDIDLMNYLDCAIAYDGPDADLISGLEHLEGQVVGVIGNDGEVIYDGDPAGALADSFRVTGGEITLPHTVTHCFVGLMLPAPTLETLDLDVEGTALRDKKKRVQALTLILERSDPYFQAGPDENQLFTWRPEPWQDVDFGDLGSDPLEIALTSNFRESGRVQIQHTRPLPFTVLGVLPNVEIGTA